MNTGVWLAFGTSLPFRTYSLSTCEQQTSPTTTLQWAWMWKYHVFLKSGIIIIILSKDILHCICLQKWLAYCIEEAKRHDEKSCFGWFKTIDSYAPSSAATGFLINMSFHPIAPNWWISLLFDVKAIEGCNSPILEISTCLSKLSWFIGTFVDLAVAHFSSFLGYYLHENTVHGLHQRF